MGNKRVERNAKAQGFIIYGCGGGRAGVLYQFDHEWPGAARAVGWDIRRVQKRRGKVIHLRRAATARDSCDHASTDGSTDCKGCDVSGMDFINAAHDFLNDIAE